MVVACADSAQLQVQGKTVTFAVSRLVSRPPPEVVQILVSVRPPRPQWIARSRKVYARRPAYLANDWCLISRPGPQFYENLDIVQPFAQSFYS